MNLKKDLTVKSVRIGLSGTTKPEIIEEMVEIIHEANKGLDKAALLQAVWKRERQMSTGMANGIAIPHGKTVAVDELHVAVAVSSYPVDFDSMDKKPSRIFIMTISPESHTGPHLQFLAEVSHLLEKEDLRNKMLAVHSGAELLRIFHEGKA